MSVSLRRQRDNKLRAFWYGEFRNSEGKRKVINLGKWAGYPPASGKATDAGDKAFEKSRIEAEIKLRDYADDARTKGRSEKLIEKLIESKTGKAVIYSRIDELANLYRKRTRANLATETHLKNCDPLFRRFVEFMSEQNQDAEYLYQVTEEDATAFRESEIKNFSKATIQSGILKLSNTFKKYLPDGVENPFQQFKGITTPGEIIHRQPLQPDELRALLDAAQTDSFMYPLIVTATCTGARQGDICNLKWSAVDLQGGMISFSTSKTAKMVNIPIFKPLRDVLESINRTDSEYVFPEAAEVYKNSRHKLGRYFKRIVVEAMQTIPPALPEQPRVDVSEILSDGIKAVAVQYSGNRGRRIANNLKYYSQGLSVRDIEKMTDIPRSTVSADLHIVQDLTGKRFLPTKPQKTRKAIQELTRQKRTQGRSASIKDWHALRTTFVTLALTAGIPIELLKKVTGHTTVDIVLENYFNPNKEQFKEAFFKAMPEVISGKKTQVKQISNIKVLAEKVATGTATEIEQKILSDLLTGGK